MWICIPIGIVNVGTDTLGMQLAKGIDQPTVFQHLAKTKLLIGGESCLSVVGGGDVVSRHLCSLPKSPDFLALSQEPMWVRHIRSLMSHVQIAYNDQLALLALRALHKAEEAGVPSAARDEVFFFIIAIVGGVEVGHPQPSRVLRNAHAAI